MQRRFLAPFAALARAAIVLSLVACSEPTDTPDAVPSGDARADAIDPFDAATDGSPDAALDARTDTAMDAVRDVPGDCANTLADGACSSCPAGFEDLGGGRCRDIDECTTGTSRCDTAPGGVCTNTAGGHTCRCATGWTGTGTGTGSCRWNDPSLVSLVPSLGTLAPSFNSATTMYTLGVTGASVTFTPTVAHPAHATIRVNNMLVPSGTASPPIAIGTAPVPVSVVVVTETGTTRTYTVMVSRRSTYIKASNPGPQDGFGHGVALSADGNTMAVGAEAESSNATGVDGPQNNDSAQFAGAVYIFTRTAGVWRQQAYLKASNTGPDDRFGRSVAVSNDGNTLIVGAPNEASSVSGVNNGTPNDSAQSAGAVYVFQRTGSTWSQSAFVKASNPELRDHFGESVAISGNGTTFAVGAPDEDSAATTINGDGADNTAGSAGAVYVFTRTTGPWSQQAYVKAANAMNASSFGTAVSLSDDGATLAVGAPGERSSGTGVNSSQTTGTLTSAGAAYVFVRSGSTWSQQAYVKSTSPSATDLFGRAIALSGDGATLAVGAVSEDSNAVGIGGNPADDSAMDSGAVYVYARSGSTWSVQGYLKASNAAVQDQFGRSVTLSRDGTVLAVGATGEDSNASGIGGSQSSNALESSGAAYLFRRSGSTWRQDAYIKASTPGNGDAFGSEIALSPDGSTLAVAAVGEDSASGGINSSELNNVYGNAGAVYVF